MCKSRPTAAKLLHTLSTESRPPYLSWMMQSCSIRVYYRRETIFSFLGSRFLGTGIVVRSSATAYSSGSGGGSGNSGLSLVSGRALPWDLGLYTAELKGLIFDSGLPLFFGVPGTVLAMSF